MAKADKATAVADIAEKFKEATATVVTEYRGLTVSNLADCAIAPLTEVLGDAARLVPNRLESLSAALVELRQDHEQVDELRERGLAHAARYSWRDTARATAHVYRGMR